MSERPVYENLIATSFLEFAFLRWILHAAATPVIVRHITPQQPVQASDHAYRIDYAITGATARLAVELDGFTFHSDRAAFTYDRMRQNDLQSAGWTVIRFSYDAIRLETARCIAQLQAAIASDTLLRSMVIGTPTIETPDMRPEVFSGFRPVLEAPGMMANYYPSVRGKLNQKTLRECQSQALAALANYFRTGGRNAACVMSVGAGKTALGVAACLSFAERRALIITPGSVIRGTFDVAFDPHASRNALYSLPGGPLIPGCLPPSVRVLDRDEGPIRGVSRADLLAADVILTNFHSLGSGNDPDDLLAKLAPEDVDLIIVDEAHISAAESYQRAFRHFSHARTILMSACFQRLDGKPIDADVVYRYRLIDSIADGNAKNLRVRRFAPRAEETTYEMVWPDGRHEEIVGRDALLDVLQDERKLARITAKSDASIRQVMQAVKTALDEQARVLYPIKPRVLFSALGERHAEQIARIADEYGIPSAHLHHSMSDIRIRAIRERFEQESGDLQGLAQLKMLGQGYDFPPITVVVPLRPYGSFSEFYQFVGRGIRVLLHPALVGRVGPAVQFLDIICHGELGLDEHIMTIYRENDMDPQTMETLPQVEQRDGGDDVTLGFNGRDTAMQAATFVLFEQGNIEQRVVHDQERVERRRAERERELLAQRYATYAQGTDNPATFEQFVQLMKIMHE